MVFIIVTVLSVLGLAFLLTFIRFTAGKDPSRRTWNPFPAREYSGWLGDGTRGLFGPGFPGRARVFVRNWMSVNYPGWKQWVFWALAASFAFCAGTGFFFAFFFKNGMFGFVLLGHVMAGALFAVGLPVALLLRARAYRPDAGPGNESLELRPLVKTLPKKPVLTILFWAFAAAGLCLIVTALASMLPYFYFRAQFPLLDFHRYGALVAVLAAAALFDLGIIPRRG